VYGELTVKAFGAQPCGAHKFLLGFRKPQGGAVKLGEKRMNSAAEEQAPLPTVMGIARECYDASNDDARAATNLMVQRVFEDDELFQALMSPLVRRACYDAIASIYITGR